MRLSVEELARLDVETAAGRIPPSPPPLPGLGPEPATLDTLIRHRRARLAKA